MFLFGGMLCCMTDVLKDHSVFKSQELFIHNRCNISEDFNFHKYVPLLYKSIEMVSGARNILTHIAWCSTCSCHYTRIFHFRESKITNHDFAIFVWTVVKEVFRLKEDKIN